MSARRAVQAVEAGGLLISAWRSGAMTARVTRFGGRSENSGGGVQPCWGHRNEHEKGRVLVFAGRDRGCGRETLNSTWQSIVSTRNGRELRKYPGGLIGYPYFQVQFGLTRQRSQVEGVSRAASTSS